MKEHTRVVVIGGGIVGAAVLYHLTKLGWSDVVLVERKQLTAGSTWHAPGGFHAMNSDHNVAKLQAYTVSVYKEVQEISGQDVGMHLTGGLSIAATKERWEALRYEYERQAVLGIESRLIDRDRESTGRSEGDRRPVSDHGYHGCAWRNIRD
jgi:dimethylglycine dehydrogenase